jgi:hypothetical protein
MVHLKFSLINFLVIKYFQIVHAGGSLNPLKLTTGSLIAIFSEFIKLGNSWFTWAPDLWAELGWRDSSRF